MSLTTADTARVPRGEKKSRRRPRPAGLDRLLAEREVRVVSINAERRARQSHARATLDKLLREHGEAHLGDVLTTMLESEGNELALTALVIKAVSAVHIAHATWFERDASAWLAIFDRVDLVALHEFAASTRVTTNVADTIATALALELAATFEPDRARWRGDSPAPPAPPPPSVEQRLRLSTTMVEVLRRAVFDEATGVARLRPATPTVTVAALRRRSLVHERGSALLTDAGRAAALECGAGASEPAPRAQAVALSG